jgi:hypothetical protein
MFVPSPRFVISKALHCCPEHDIKRLHTYISVFGSEEADGQ